MLGNTIAKLRKSKGLTQAQMANAIHVTQGAISQWETGRTMPDVQQMFILADFFGLTVEELKNGGAPLDAKDKANKTPPQDPPAWSQFGPETRKILREILGKLEGMDDEQLKAVEVVVDALGKKKG